jgi:REP element-mobilizing transposase RayT
MVKAGAAHRNFSGTVKLTTPTRNRLLLQNDFFTKTTTMANTFSQAHFHLVFAVKHRQALIQRSWKDELERYITGIVQNHQHKMLAIGSMPDHIHNFSWL